jgi:hypothetical protein
MNRHDLDDLPPGALAGIFAFCAGVLLLCWIFGRLETVERRIEYIEKHVGIDIDW